MPSNVIPDTHLDLLEKPLLIHVATIGPKGEPQSNPVWFLYENGLVYLAIGPNGQKYRNLQRDPRIALSLADPDDPLHYLEIRGTVTSWQTVDSAHPRIVAVVRKYTGDDTYEGEPPEHTVVGVEPLRTTSMG